MAGLPFGAGVATDVVLLLRPPVSRLVAWARATGFSRVLGTQPAAA